MFSEREEEKLREIGGYIELDRYTMPMLHDGALALNCGRNCLAYLIRARGIKKILLPFFLCNSVRDVCIKQGVKIRHYYIGVDFTPTDVKLQENEWLYVVNYYGQMNNTVLNNIVHKHKRVIIDNAQAYFQMPLQGVDTLYTCRKFFGVADGAFLYTDAVLEEELPRDKSYERMHFLLGRFEKTASEFYHEYTDNNHLFAEEPIKRMSKLTENLLHGIDYGTVKDKRTKNFTYLHKAFCMKNKLILSVQNGSFMYPLYIANGSEIRRKLLAEKIYIPILWPDVFEKCEKIWLEYDMAENILPLPVDQRYGIEEMEYIIRLVSQFI